VQKRLTQAEIGEAVYPFLGPGRTIEHVEGARAAVEALYKEKGFQTVNVEVPDQDARRGIVLLKVNENTVGRLRVKGSRYFSLAEIKKRAPSLAEGNLPNFNEITKDILALNTWADRRVTPSLHAGVEPGPSTSTLK
jgi:hemolysin activation/secretion protein